MMEIDQDNDSQHQDQYDPQQHTQIGQHLDQQEQTI